jgi:hypothetical protein
MRNLYSLYAPALVQPDHIVDVAVLLDAWSGREQELLERVEAEYVLAQFTLEAGVLQPLSDLDASELSKQSKFGEALIRVLHDGLERKLDQKISGFWIADVTESAQDTKQVQSTKSVDEKSGMSSGMGGGGGNDDVDYENLQVAPDVQELFEHIGQYQPRSIELEAVLKPFIPDFIAGIGDANAFIEVPRPDGAEQTLGLTILDEPMVVQDPRVLELQLRASAKMNSVVDATVRSVESTDRVEDVTKSVQDNIEPTRSAKSIVKDEDLSPLNPEPERERWTEQKEISEAIAASAELETQQVEMQQLEEAQLTRALAESVQEQLKEARAAQKQLEEAHATALKAKALAESKAEEAERALASERKLQLDKQEKAAAAAAAAAADEQKAAAADAQKLVDEKKLADEKSRIMTQHEAERQAVIAMEASEKDRQKRIMHQRLKGARAALIKRRQEKQQAAAAAAAAETQPPDYKAKQASLLRMRKERGEETPKWLEPGPEPQPEPTPIWLQEPEPQQEPEQEPEPEPTPIWLQEPEPEPEPTPIEAEGAKP